MKSINKLTILTLLLLAMTTTMSNVAIVTSLPHLKEYFINENNIEFYSRLMLTLPSLAIALLSPILGHIIFKFGKKKSALIALFCFSLFGTGGLYLNSIESLLLSRVFFGISIAVLMIVSTSLVGDYFSENQRHKFMSFQSAFMAIGGVFFVYGGGVLSDINWRYSFGIYLIGVFLIPLALIYLKEKKELSLDVNNQEISTGIFIIYFLAFFFMLIFFILPTQIPFLLIEKFQATGAFAGAIIASAFFSNAIGSIIFSKLKTKFSFLTIYLIGLFLTALGLTLVGFINNVYLFFISSPILGFAGGIMMPNVTAWMLSKTTFEKRVKSSGYFTSSLFLGQFLSPIIFHPLVAIYDIQTFFIIIGLSLLFITFISFLFIFRVNK